MSLCSFTSCLSCYGIDSSKELQSRAGSVALQCTRKKQLQRYCWLKFKTKHHHDSWTMSKGEKLTHWKNGKTHSTFMNEFVMDGQTTCIGSCSQVVKKQAYRLSPDQFTKFMDSIVICQSYQPYVCVVLLLWCIYH